ncbi:MAG: 5-formyltetrahydrofolate cyclo-ligase [Gammaproteobacteria bacterium]|nr:MAG: 5-formyltetrahydrofolate cyclo-ligase [Gammaproteobacteria bacterium]RKZ43437.1 MAG: 5-formyltetrahydrofolate cyclo-ligase [Gammaproteobacteria bacterium]RKZ73120.1 MAG: 5-formyltetrahydrofolate cyclo-ligase [Gammaproteobacteria bacterium]
MNKNQLRKQFLSKRKTLSLESLQEKSLSISEQFFKHFDLCQVKRLHLFLPILKQNEINTWLIIDEIRQHYPSVTLITSKSHFQTLMMESFVLKSDTKIMENKWGIPEPINAEKCPDDMIDMILLPLLCFDRQGYRVGYGKGFYDRFLQKCRKDIIKIGLSLFEPVDKIDDANENDVKMDFCVMTDKLIVN